MIAILAVCRLFITIIAFFNAIVKFVIFIMSFNSTRCKSSICGYWLFYHLISSLITDKIRTSNAIDRCQLSLNIVETLCFFVAILMIVIGPLYSIVIFLVVLVGVAIGQYLDGDPKIVRMVRCMVA